MRTRRKIASMLIAALSLASARADGPAAPARPEMVWIPGGEFAMGGPTDSTPADAPPDGDAAAARCPGLAGGFADARPIHRVRVAGFWMDATEVTNAQFARFVAATGYVTVAERAPSPAEFPGVPAEALVPGALVFAAPPAAAVPSLADARLWWRYEPGASWRRPGGPGTSVDGLGELPVVHVAFDDARA